MIYLDTSAAAKLFLDEDSRAEVEDLIAGQPLVSSVLLDIELSKVWQRAGGTGHGYRALTDQGAKVDIRPEIVNRTCAIQAVRSLDAIHLATALFLQDSGLTISLLCFDNHLREAAELHGIRVIP